MADVTNIVDPDNATGTDYTSLNAWEAQTLDLITALDTETADCRSSSGTADTTAVNIAGWTTSSTYDITIKQASSDAHSGIWDSTVYRLSISNNYGIRNGNTSNLYLNIDGLQIEITSTNTTNQVAIIDRGAGATSTVLVENAILRGYASNSQNYCDGIQYYSAGTSTYTVRNCVLYDFLGANSGAIAAWDGGSTMTVENVTAHNCNRGMYRYGGTFTATNVATIGCTDGFSGTFDAASDYNCSDIASDAPGTNAVGTTQTDAQLFNDATVDDFNVADTSSDLYNAGTDLSATFTTDIAGTTRSTWDIGAFELVSGTTYNESLTLAANASMSQVNINTIEVAVTLGAGAGMTPGDTATLEASLTLAANADLLQSAVGDLLAALNLDASAGMAQATSMVMGASIILAASAAMAQDGVIAGTGTTYEEALTLAASVGSTQTVEMLLDQVITFDISASQAQAAQQDLAAGISLDAAVSQSQSAQQDHEASISLDAAMALAQAAIWAGDVSLALSVVADMLQAGQVGEAAIISRWIALHLADSYRDLNASSSNRTLDLAKSFRDLDS